MSFLNIPVLVRGRTIWDKVQFPNKEFENRHDGVRKLIEQNNLDGLLIYSNSLRNGPICYLTNYHCFITFADALYVFPKEGTPVLLASQPTRDVQRIKSFIVDSIDFEAVGLSLVSNHHLAEKVAAYLTDKGLAKKRWGGVNLGDLTYLAAGPLQKVVGEIQDYTGVYDQLRVRKSKRELSVMNQAAQMAKRAALEIIRGAKPDVTEYAITAEVDRQLRYEGVEEVNILIAADDNPEYLRFPSQRAFEEGDTIHVYVAIKYLRYWGAFGTTAVIGQPSNEQVKLYQDMQDLYEKVINDINQAKEIDREWFNKQKLNKELISPFSSIKFIGQDLDENMEGQKLIADMTLNLTLGLKQEECSVFMSESFVVQENGSLFPLSGIRQDELIIA